MLALGGILRGGLRVCPGAGAAVVGLWQLAVPADHQRLELSSIEPQNTHRAQCARDQVQQGGLAGIPKDGEDQCQVREREAHRIPSGNIQEVAVDQGAPPGHVHCPAVRNQQARQHNIPKAQDGCAREVREQVRHHQHHGKHLVRSPSRSNLDHDAGAAEDERLNKHPEDVVKESHGQENHCHLHVGQVDDSQEHEGKRYGEGVLQNPGPGHVAARNPDSGHHR
mmetsp:Transcript_33824/g.95758  ORF Transcript_33824/g.95758 Transcript_33824/m.95758 type:complete len:224 (-) Transcript_33824:1162-1833(-)